MAAVGVARVRRRLVLVLVILRRRESRKRARSVPRGRYGRVADGWALLEPRVHRHVTHRWRSGDEDVRSVKPPSFYLRRPWPRGHHRVVLVDVMQMRLWVSTVHSIQRHRARSRSPTQVVRLDHAWVRRYIGRHAAGAGPHEVGRRGAERRRRGSRRGYIAAAALRAVARVLAGRGERSVICRLASASRLVSVVGVLALVADLLLLREPLPVVLDVLGLLPPLLADELRYLRVRESGVTCRDLPLVVLSVKNEGC